VSRADASFDELLHRYAAPGLTDLAGGLPAVPLLLCLIVDDHDTMIPAATIPCMSYSTGDYLFHGQLDVHLVRVRSRFVYIFGQIDVQSQGCRRTSIAAQQTT
jgi:hypothetical protein